MTNRVIAPSAGWTLWNNLLLVLKRKTKSYKNLLRKFKTSVIFTAPVFLIAMSEMIHNNPLMTIMPLEILELDTAFTVNSSRILYCMDVF